MWGGTAMVSHYLGERRKAKLIVSVSFGTQAPFKWRGKFGPDSDVSSCWLGHGDIRVMDGQYQDVLHHCTDPGSEQERINVTNILLPVRLLGISTWSPPRSLA